MSLTQSMKKSRQVNIPPPKKRKKSQTLKELLYGDFGVGKTYTAVLGPLLNGEKVFVFSTDFGTDGLESVDNELIKRGREDLIDQYFAVSLGAYEEVQHFLDNPEEVLYHEESEIPDDWVPTVIVWDGGSAFNQDYVDREVSPTLKIDRQDAGSYDHWTGVNRGTITTVRKFISLRVKGHEPHKILTCLLDEEKHYGPSINSGARRLIMGPFGVVLHLFREEKVEQGKIKVEYKYRCEGDETRYKVKNRGYNLPPVMSADPVKLWQILKGEKNES